MAKVVVARRTGFHIFVPMTSDDEPVEIPITGELDLHTFAPRETAAVLDAYVDACLSRGLYALRVIHGKGTGTRRETVHAWLRRDPRVLGFRLGDESSGGWGATLVQLAPRSR